jgi:hypothetical protein
MADLPAFYALFPPARKWRMLFAAEVGEAGAAEATCTARDGTVNPTLDPPGHPRKT